jgi:hypothetical protein
MSRKSIGMGFFDMNAGCRKQKVRGATDAFLDGGLLRGSGWKKVGRPFVPIAI